MDDTQLLLDDLARQYQVPGAVLAFHDGTKTHEYATGVLNTATGVPTTTDSLFQIGSITKVWTATLVMQLVEEGRVRLDQPVREVLPEFRVADPDATAAVTVRQLLTHTSGIDGDHFVDTGRGDGCVERYVATCADVAQIHPPGATLSYCNSGYIVLGRLIEHLTGQTWDAALRERLIDPLGLTHTVTLPEEALLFRAAVGHLDGRPAPVWAPPRSAGPAGLICARAADVVAFGRWQLEKGPAAMRVPQAEIPEHGNTGSWGLGWMLDTWDGREVIGHSGATIGQYARLYAVPDAGVVACLVTNGGQSAAFQQAVFTTLFADVCDLRVRPRPEPPTAPPTVDLETHVGVYERAGARLTVTLENGALSVLSETTGAMAAMSPSVRVEEVVPVGAGAFVGRFPGDPTWFALTFYRLPDGTPALHAGMRATPKVR
ncbi:serine hydrolase domain-containing protein [Longispora urticae]